jgi:hypothetical protein
MTTAKPIASTTMGYHVAKAAVSLMSIRRGKVEDEQIRS